MNNSNSEARPQHLKRLQYRNLILVGILLFLLLGGIFMLLEVKSPPHTAKISGKEVRFTHAIGEKQIYNASIEQLQTQMRQYEEMEQQLKQQLQSLQQAALRNKANKNTTHLEQQYSAVVVKLNALEKQLQALLARSASAAPTTFPTTASGTSTNTNTLQFPTIPQEPNDAYIHSGFAVTVPTFNGDDHLHLIPRTTTTIEIPEKNPNTYVPAGTHVLGVLLQGADLVADRYDQENPKPILIRLIARGTLPNHARSHLKGCIITAAMNGDISSGRGNVRLERLSCVRPNHSIIDVPVYGTVSTHAKEGITGAIYSRENQRLFDATFSGTLAGIANSLSQGYVQYTPSNNGPVRTVNSSDLFKYGMAQGGATGLNKLSDFEMNRVDQIHPMIEVNGGQLVTVIFLKGFFFDGKNSLNSNINSNPWRKPTSQNPLSTSGHSLTHLLNGD